MAVYAFLLFVVLVLPHCRYTVSCLYYAVSYIRYILQTFHYSTFCVFTVISIVLLYIYLRSATTLPTHAVNACCCRLEAYLPAFLLRCRAVLLRCLLTDVLTSILTTLLQYKTFCDRVYTSYATFFVPFSDGGIYAAMPSMTKTGCRSSPL